MEIDDRVRELEQRVAGAESTVHHLRTNLDAAWSELAALRKEQRDEFRQLRVENDKKASEIMSAITANKVGAAAMRAGARAVAWLFLALLTAGGTIAAIATAVRKWLPSLWGG